MNTEQATPDIKVELTDQEKKLAAQAQEEQFQAESKRMKEQTKHLNDVVLPLRRLQTELLELKARTAVAQLQELRAFVEIEYIQNPPAEEPKPETVRSTETATQDQEQPAAAL